jgi:hypothetical protein
MRSFASGCTAMTGVKAVSNGVGAFSDPSVVHALRSLTAIILLMAIMLAGIAYLCGAYGIGATEPGQPGYDSILSQLTAADYYTRVAHVLGTLPGGLNGSYFLNPSSSTTAWRTFLTAAPAWIGSWPALVVIPRTRSSTRQAERW